MNDYFQSRMFNPQYVNPNYYHALVQQQYEADQNKKVVDAVKAIHDLCEAVKGMDAAHQEIAFRACVTQMGIELGW